MRLEAVVIGGVANNAVFVRERFKTGNFPLIARPERLLHQDVLFVLEAVAEKLDLGLIRDAGQHRVIVGKWNVDNGPIACFLVDRVDVRYKVIAGNPAAFMSLNSEARDHHSHRWTAQTRTICRSMASILDRKSSAVTGMLPSHSHSSAAAMLPRIVAMPASPTASMASVA